MKKTVLITGGTGLIGGRLISELLASGYSILATSRNAAKFAKNTDAAIRYIQWDGKSLLSGFETFGKIDAIVHLAGAGVADKRWTEAYKKEILESRTISTNLLIESFRTVEQKPTVFICGSATGFYGSSAENTFTESSPKGEGFLADICDAWEKASASAEVLGMRRVSIRTGIVLDNKKGALPKMLTPFKLFFGGKLGSGKQWFSWIHVEDIVQILKFALETNTMQGAYNATSPNPIRMEDMAKAIGKTLHRPSLFPVPEFLLNIVLGESAYEITKSQKVLPKKIINAGYEFRFPNLENALKNLTGKE